MNPTTKSAPSTKTTVVRDDDQLPYDLDQICCPKCSELQTARILNRWPRREYKHTCVVCRFVIRKKDWISVL